MEGRAKQDCTKELSKCGQLCTFIGGAKTGLGLVFQPLDHRKTLNDLARLMRHEDYSPPRTAGFVTSHPNISTGERQSRKMQKRAKQC